MKKTTYLFAIFIAFYSFSFAQCPGTPEPGYTCIPDAAFEQALINFGYDSEGVLDGRILTADAEAANGTLGLANQGLTDLTGLEAFINLDGVDFSYNTALAALDVTANVNLIDVNLEGCASLSSLNVSGLTALENINVYGSVLTTVDLLTNTSLLVFNARFAALQTMDFSANASILDVNLRNNTLTFVDMRNGNNALTVLRADNNNGPGCILVNDETETNLVNWNPGGLSIYETEGECPTLSVEKENSTVFSIYPNPAKGYVNVSSNLEATTNLGVYDITGKLVLTNTISFGNNKLNIASLSSGIYLMRVSTSTKTITKKLIIK
ncbi:T9SS type A sorting domain-containing protein [Bizionia myxarmorum]|nr:T9SS type A sorting domain-containing protein [Bizionia myxarmorum]